MNKNCYQTIPLTAEQQAIYDEYYNLGQLEAAVGLGILIVVFLGLLALNRAFIR